MSRDFSRRARLRRAHTNVIHVLALAVGFLAPGCCLSPIATLPIEDPAEWTIMVYLNGDNNLESHAIDDFLELVSVQGSSRVNVLVQFDRTSSGPSVHGNWPGTYRFRAVYGITPHPRYAVENLGEVNMGSAEELAGFVRWSRERFPAQRYGLILWGHGRGWRSKMIVRESSTPETLRAARAKGRDSSRRGGFSTDEALELDQTLPSAMRIMASDDGADDKLYNSEIARALTATLAGQRLDLIGMDACLMAMVETAYEFAPLAKVMVASEELEPPSGWAHHRWLHALVQNPTMSEADLGRAIVRAYRAEYGEEWDHTLSAIDLAAMDGIAGKVSELAEILIRKLPDAVSELRAVREHCLAYGSSDNLHGIDIAYFCERLAERTQDGEIRSAAQAVTEKVHAAVLAKMAGEQRRERYGSHGLAIYFPPSGEAFQWDSDACGYLESNRLFPVAFVGHHKWDNFLHEYFRYVPR